MVVLNGGCGSGYIILLVVVVVAFSTNYHICIAMHT